MGREAGQGIPRRSKSNRENEGERWRDRVRRERDPGKMNSKHGRVRTMEGKEGDSVRRAP